MAQARAATTRGMTKQHMGAGQRSYEERRAAKAGMSLDKWLETKRKRQEEAARAEEKAAPKEAKKPGLISRLIERAHRPLGGG